MFSIIRWTHSLFHQQKSCLVWFQLYLCLYTEALIDGLGYDCSISIANVLEILLFCIKLSLCLTVCHLSNGRIFRVTGICVGNSPVTGEFPAQRPVRRALMLPLICVWINGWVNNRKAGDLRRHRAHYDVTIMKRYMIDISPHWE